MKILIQNLKLAYEERTLFDKASMAIDKPGIYPLIGLNGAGKTSLCRLLTGLLRPNKGRIEINGKNPASLTPLEKSKIFSYLPQQEDIAPHVSVRELLKMSFFYRDSFYWRVEFGRREKTLLENFGLASRLDFPFGQLSGGEKRKALLASIFLRESPIIILDEPFTFLDPKRKDEISKLIEAEIERLIIVSSHDKDFVKKHLKNTFYLKDSAIERAETCDDVFDKVYR